MNHVTVVTGNYNCEHYLHTIVVNPLWSLKKKLGTLVLSGLCFVPYSPLSDFVVRYISNSLARRRVAGY